MRKFIDLHYYTKHPKLRQEESPCGIITNMAVLVMYHARGSYSEIPNSYAGVGHPIIRGVYKEDHLREVEKMVTADRGQEISKTDLVIRAAPRNNLLWVETTLRC